MSLVNQLKRHEGLRLHPYRCTAGKLTIGVGRNLDDVGLSEEEAEYLLMNDIKVATDELYEALPFVKNMDEIRRNVLINMVFNLGISRFKKFRRTIMYLEAGNYAMASTEMLDSSWAKQVGDRALELSNQMLTGQEKV